MTKEANNNKKGEIIQCIKDTNAKALFGNVNNLDITTFIVSCILKIDYKELEGNISLQPLKIIEGVKNEMVPECDVVIKVKLNNKERIIVLEFNYFTMDLASFFKNSNYTFKEKKNLSKAHQLKLNRNLFYVLKIISSRIKKGNNYTEIIPVTLVNFNTFSKKNKKLNKYGVVDILDTSDYYSENLEIFNLDIVKCYQAVYNNKYQGSNIYEENLIIMGAIMATNKYSEVKELVARLHIKEEIKERMMEVIENMMGEGELGLYYYPDQEKKDFDEALLELCRKEGRSEGINIGMSKGINIGRSEGINLGRAEGLTLGRAEQQRDMVISLNDQHISLDVIAKAAKISINKVKQIINDYLKNNK